MSKFAPHRSSASNPRASQSTICQKCLGTGHYTYQCKNSRPYVSRPSRTEQLENPRVLAKLKVEGKSSVDVPEEFKSKVGTANRILEAKERERGGKKPERKKAKRSSSHTSSSSSGSDTSSSDSDSDSDSDTSGSDSDSSSGSSSRSRERDESRRVPRRRSNSYGSDRERGRSTSEKEAGGSSHR